MKCYLSHYLFSLLPLVFLILTEFLDLASGVAGKGSFGDACGLSRPCDHDQHLSCIKNTCQCESPSNQRFDNSSKKCVSVVGGSCTLPYQLRGGIRVKECIKNAHCVEVPDEKGNTFTECQCLDSFLENSEGECVPGIGQPCSYLPNECNPLGMVVCKDEKCQCLDDLQVYDSDMKRCVSPAGTHCKYDDLQLGCVKNALCYPFFYWIPPKCLCKPGYIQTKSRQCVLESEYKKTAPASSTNVAMVEQHEQTSKRRQLSQTEFRPPSSPGSSPSSRAGWPPVPILGTMYINHTAPLVF